jgi:hypothetical protein
LFYCRTTSWCRPARRRVNRPLTESRRLLCGSAKLENYKCIVTQNKYVERGHVCTICT